jgi:hypothetical protein
MRVIPILSILAVALLMLPPAAHAAAVIYDGDLAATSPQVKVEGWGSGTAEETTETRFIGKGALRITSQGPYQGVRLELAEGLDLSQQFGDKTSYLEMWIRAAKLYTLPPPPPPKPAASAAAPVPTAPAPARSQGVGGTFDPYYTGEDEPSPPPPPPPPVPAAPPPTAAPATPAPPAQPGLRLSLYGIRVVLVTDKGDMEVSHFPVSPVTADGRGWIQVAIPLAKFRGAPDPTTLKAVWLFADRSDKFDLGRLQVIEDTDPIRVIPTGGGNGSVGHPLRFVADVKAGCAQTEVRWDFSDAEGVTSTAVGTRVYHVFRQPGQHKVTYTVTDLAGGKPPVTGTLTANIS